MVRGRDGQSDICNGQPQGISSQGVAKAQSAISFAIDIAIGLEDAWDNGKTGDAAGLRQLLAAAT
jgi:hypothetical protein